MLDLLSQGDLVATALSLLFPAAVLFFAYLIRGIAGFGSALIAVPLLTLVMPITLVVPLVVFLDYLGSATQGVGNKEHIAWHDIWPLLPFSLIGVVISLYLMESIDQHILTLCLGAFVILFAVYQLLPLKFGRASSLVACPAGFFGGFVGTLFGTGGPFYVIYLNLRQLDKVTFRATFAALFLIDGAMRLVGYALKGFYNLETFYYILCAVPVAGLGLYFGGRIHTALGREAFVRLISVLLLGSGTALLMKA
ncbi:MAG: sulfite exporter TauE/SafE family protein [Gammaproteobacteria bacterium]